MRDFDFRFIEFYSIFGKKCFCGKNQYEIHVRLDRFDFILGSGRRFFFRARPTVSYRLFFIESVPARFISDHNQQQTGSHRSFKLPTSKSRTCLVENGKRKSLSLRTPKRSHRVFDHCRRLCVYSDPSKPNRLLRPYRFDVEPCDDGSRSRCIFRKVPRRLPLLRLFAAKRSGSPVGIPMPRMRTAHHSKRKPARSAQRQKSRLIYRMIADAVGLFTSCLPEASDSFSQKTALLEIRLSDTDSLPGCPPLRTT